MKGMDKYKEMFRKVLALSLSLGMAISTPVMAAATATAGNNPDQKRTEKENADKKDETVYVFMDASGNTTKPW